MAVFERDILQTVEFMSQGYPEVVVALNDDRRIIFVGGEEGQILFDLISTGEYLEQTALGRSEGFGKFIDAAIHSESYFPGYHESIIEGRGNILWHGSCLDSGIIILRGKVVRECGKIFSEPDKEIDSLRNKERILSNLLKNMPGMAYRCRNDLERTMIFVSDGCDRLTGYKPSELLGSSRICYADLILAEYRAHVWECVQEAVQDCQDFEVIYKISTKNGEHKWVWEKGGDVYREGEFVTVAGFITDITPLMDAEQALQQSAERYRLMAEKTGQMIYDLDLHTEKIIWSGAVFEITGKSETEFQSVDLNKWEQLVHPDDRAKVLHELEISIREIKPFLSEYRFRQHGGDYIYVEEEGDFVLDANDKPVRMVGTIKNYSARMRMQELMIQSEKMATVASLSAGMAHEINNPLGVISQSAQNIERRLSPQLSKNIEIAEAVGAPLDRINNYLEKRKILSMLEAIKKASSRAAGILIKMLDFSRNPAETKDLCDLTQIVDMALEMAENDFNSGSNYDFRKIRIVRETSRNLPKISCLRGEMEQAVFNLLRNSAQAMLSQGNCPDNPQITIRLLFDKAYINMEIEDNGPGMDEQTRKKFLNLFLQPKPKAADLSFPSHTSSSSAITAEASQLSPDPAAECCLP